MPEVGGPRRGPSRREAGAAARRLRHGLRRLCDRGVRAERDRLPAEARAARRGSPRRSTRARDAPQHAGTGRRARGSTVAAAATAYERAARRAYLERIPVRRRDDVVIIVPVRQIASIVAEARAAAPDDDGQRALHHHPPAPRARGPARSAALRAPRAAARSRTSTASPASARCRAEPRMATLANGQELPISRIQARVLRETLLKL